MNKNFLKSVISALTAISFIASCSALGLKKESHNCSAKNGCATKKDEATKSVSVKDENQKNSTKKEAVKKSEKKSKKSKKAKTSQEVTPETKINN